MGMWCYVHSLKHMLLFAYGCVSSLQQACVHDTVQICLACVSYTHGKIICLVGCFSVLWVV